MELLRNSTGLRPLDTVLGGGLVPGSVVLFAAPQCSGKTSLTLQMLAGLQHRCLFVTGEETREQVTATAARIGVSSMAIDVCAERNLEKIFERARKLSAQTIAIDAIQRIFCEGAEGLAGLPKQLKECTARLVDYAKTTETAVWLIGHMTLDGVIAGPKTIQHDVDVVIKMKQGAKFKGNERILRCSDKNRFGATNVVGRFELTTKGFVAVDADG
jgi:DNA repair protein RadA/Sms